MKSKKAKVVVIGGSTGSGESTVTKKVIEKIPEAVRLVTATTRSPRENERNGVDYYFMSESDFEKAALSGDILERTCMPDRDVCYGTYRPALTNALKRAKILFVNPDIVGMRYFRDRYGAATIFVMPGSLDEIEGRIKKRNPSMNSQELAVRLRYAKREIDTESPEYTHRVINANGKLDDAVNNVIEILKKEGYLDA